MNDKSTKEKVDRMYKIANRNAGLKQDDIARILNVPLSPSKNIYREWQY